MGPDQLASEKPDDQDPHCFPFFLHCFQNRIISGSAWLGSRIEYPVKPV